jgi:ElaB/YqjD/DUF883 family membrane-anchored ribosome-binding protein
MNGQSRSILSENGEWILSAIKRNPEGLLLLAAGAALLLRTGSRPSGGARSMAAASGGDHHASGPGAVQSAVRQTIDAASDAARQTAETAASYASTASDYADRARRSVSDQSDRIARQTQSMASNVLQNQPLAILAVGIAAGAGVAAMFPPTDWERDNLGPIGDEVSKAAGKIGDQLIEATSRAGDTLKTAADKRGLSTEGLKGVAEEVVGTFKDSLKGQSAEPDTKFTGAQSPAGSRYDQRGR